jgi:hypothetical protein
LLSWEVTFVELSILSLAYTILWGVNKKAALQKPLFVFVTSILYIIVKRLNIGIYCHLLPITAIS